MILKLQAWYFKQKEWLKTAPSITDESFLIGYDQCLRDFYRQLQELVKEEEGR